MAATSLAGVQDILYHIVSHVAADLNDIHGKGTHSNFTQPALAVLWRYLPSDKALKHLLCILGIAQKLLQNNWWCKPWPTEMCGTPVTHEPSWTRFQEYAALVREIIVDPLVRTADLRAKLLHDTFWCQLSPALGNRPILPRLEVATLLSTGSFFLCHESFDMGALCLLNPAIRELKMIFPHIVTEDETRLRGALSTTFSSSQNLQVLSLQVPVRVLDVESLPQSHPRLRHLKLDGSPCIDPSHLISLATLPTLESLSISLSPQDLLSLPVKFAGLQSLSVSSYHFDAIGALFAHVDAPQLQSLSISETHKDSSAMHRELSNHLRALLAKCPSLTSFHWQSTQVRARKVGYLGDRCAGATLAELVGPLLSRRSIRSFSARFEGPVVPYSSTDFRTIAEAWPDVEVFYLSDFEDAGSAADQYADVDCILAFARHCPRLRSLFIPRLRFDSDAFRVDLVRPPAPHWLRKLTVDHVAYSGEQDRDRRRELVVQFRGLMEKVFPSVIICMYYR